MLEGVHGLCDMEADVAAEIGANNLSTGVFEEACDGIPNDASIEVTDVENFERVRVAKFADYCLTFELVRGIITVIIINCVN